jgi:hypothetical protein
MEFWFIEVFQAIENSLDKRSIDEICGLGTSICFSYPFWTRYERGFGHGIVY